MNLRLFFIFIAIFTIFSSATFASKSPNLGVENTTSDWKVTVSYTTEEEPNGSFILEPGFSKGMPMPGYGLPVMLTNLFFQNSSGGSLPFENWCPNISPKQSYQFIDVRIFQTGNDVKVICNGH